MLKRLTRHGNSYALVIDKAILELLKITPETPLELSTNGHELTIRPLEELPKEILFHKTALATRIPLSPKTE